jgi:hypothetical protein
MKDHTLELKASEIISLFQDSFEFIRNEEYAELYLPEKDRVGLHLALKALDAFGITYKFVDQSEGYIYYQSNNLTREYLNQILDLQRH